MTISKRLQVAQAVLALVAAALPGAEVLGLDGEDAVPDRVGAGGRAAVHSGSPGKPEIDLSPLAYNYLHRFPVDLFAASETTIDAMLVAIGAAIEADRTLGGLVDWLDAEPPETADEALDGAPTLRVATPTITAAYSTPHPL